jgi:ubiquinone/menaquinone biosynthesis C-methylase UbiE
MPGTNEPGNKPPLSSRLIIYLLKFFFYLLYHSFAWTYDFVASLVSTGKWKDWVLVASRYGGRYPVLEIGHGPGHLQLDLAKSGERVYGVDASWQMSRQAHRRLVHAGLPARLVNGKSQALPFSEGVFNSVVATFPTEYIMDPSTLKEIWRIMKPGGELVVIPLAWITGNSLSERWAAWLFQLTKQSPSKTQMKSKDNETNSFLDRSGKSLIERFQKAGFVAHVQIIDLTSSELMLILAEKPCGRQTIDQFSDPNS